MTTRIKIYRITLPFTLQEWRRGQRYIVTQLTTNDVQILYQRTKKVDHVTTTETHKVMSIQNRLPSLIRKLIPDDACVLDEFSTNMDAFCLVQKETDSQTAKITECELNSQKQQGGRYENIVMEKGNREGALAHLKMHKLEIPEGMSLNKCITTYKNRHFDTSTFNLVIKTHVSQHTEADPFGLGDTVPIEDVDFRSFSKKSIGRVGDRDYSGNWTEEYPHVECYKLVEVSVNRFGVGWIANEVLKVLRNMLIDVQQKIVLNYDEWRDMTEEMLRKCEDEMIERLMVDVKVTEKK